MRENKYRGTIKNPTELFSGFVYGDLIHYANGDVAIRQIETGQEFEVYPETVGQFTGLKDKNGKDIYEGDIIKSTHTESDNIGRFYFNRLPQSLNGFIEYIDIRGSFQLTMFENDLNIISTSIGWSHEDFEIIGNIHENAELLK